MALYGEPHILPEVVYPAFKSNLFIPETRTAYIAISVDGDVTTLPDALSYTQETYVA